MALSFRFFRAVPDLTVQDFYLVVEMVSQDSNHITLRCFHSLSKFGAVALDNNGFGLYPKLGRDPPLSAGHSGGSAYGLVCQFSLGKV